MMRIRHIPRERDEELLEWIRRKIDGWTWGEIARAFGRSAVSVQNACFNVRKADAAESGEDVTGAYW